MNKIRLEIYDNKFYEDPGGAKTRVVPYALVESTRVDDLNV